MGKLPERSQTHSCVVYSKAQKQQESPELAEHLQRLDLKERPGGVPLARIQRLFSFKALGSGCFPQAEKESFQERLALIPSGIVSAFACILSFIHLVEGLSR
jgi:separase